MADDSVVSLAKLAFKMRDRGDINDKQLMRVLQQCVNVTALENGYAERHGVPFPEVMPEHLRHPARREFDFSDEFSDENEFEP